MRRKKCKYKFPRFIAKISKDPKAATAKPVKNEEIKRMASIEKLDSKARDRVMMRALVFHRCILAKIDALLAFRDPNKPIL